MNAVANLFSEELYKDFHERNKKGPRNLKEEVIQFFVDNVKNKKGKSYGFVFMKMKLAHLTSDLDYASFRSEFKDIMNRRGIDAACKYFWWSLKPQ